MKYSQLFSAGCLVAVIGFGGTAAAWGDEEAGKMLVLGDSVAFGFIATEEDLVGYSYTRPENFFSFSDDLGERLHLDVVNASCPGATTGSFLSLTAPDNGCKDYRELYHLHVDYGSTQLDFATHYLRTHRDVRLVTITLGANDGLLLEQSCHAVPTCIVGGLSTVTVNMGTILAELRATGYSGAIVLTNYYSTDYTDSTQSGITELTGYLNAAIAAPAAAYGAVVADVFTVFEAVAFDPAFGGHTCKTGLLNPNPSSPNLCNEHPALTGHRLIAKTIVSTLKDARE